MRVDRGEVKGTGLSTTDNAPRWVDDDPVLAEERQALSPSASPSQRLAQRADGECDATSAFKVVPDGHLFQGEVNIFDRSWQT